MTQERPYKRRTIFINRSYQFKFILKFCLILLLGGVVSTGLVFLLSRETLTTSFERGRLVVQNTATAILPAVILTNGITLAIVMVIAVVTVLYISHKIAGPMFRFEKEIVKLKEGDLTTRITLRKKDQFISLGQSFNEMTARLHDKVSAVESEILEIEKRLREQKPDDNRIAELERIRISLHSHFNL